MGRHAVHAGMAGKSGMIVGQEHARFIHVPIPTVNASTGGFGYWSTGNLVVTMSRKLLRPWRMDSTHGGRNPGGERPAPPHVERALAGDSSLRLRQHVFDVRVANQLLSGAVEREEASFDHSVTTRVDDGVLDIEFVHDEDNSPIVSGIEIELLD